MAETLAEVQPSSPVDRHAAPPRKTSFRRWWWIPLSAAALLLIALSPRLDQLRDGTASVLSPTQALVRELAPPTRGNGSVVSRLGSDALDPPWSSVRGSPQLFVSGSRRGAFRSGVLLSRIEFGSDAEDRGFVDRMSSELQTTLLPLRGSAALSARARQLSALPSATAREWSALGSDVRQITEPGWYDLGYWLSAVEVASSVEADSVLSDLGSLGRSFRFPDSSEIATEIEVLVDALVTGADRSVREGQIRALLLVIERTL